MADIAKSGTPSLCSQLPPHGHRIPFDGLDSDDDRVLGEDVEAGDACCVRTDGLVYRQDCTGGAPAANASFHGFAPQALKAGEPISLIWGERFSYGASLTPGTFYYGSADNEGQLAAAKAFDGQQPVCFAIDDAVVQILPPHNGLDVLVNGASIIAANAIAALTDSTTGIADGTVSDVGGAFSQSAINNNFKELTVKVNAIIAALQA